VPRQETADSVVWLNTYPAKAGIQLLFRPGVFAKCKWLLLSNIPSLQAQILNTIGTLPLLRFDRLRAPALFQAFAGSDYSF
jgi:hypothetical protein